MKKHTDKSGRKTTDIQECDQHSRASEAYGAADDKSEKEAIGINSPRITEPSWEYDDDDDDDNIDNYDGYDNDYEGEDDDDKVTKLNNPKTFKEVINKINSLAIHTTFDDNDDDDGSDIESDDGAEGLPSISSPSSSSSSSYNNSDIESDEEDSVNVNDSDSDSDDDVDSDSCDDGENTVNILEPGTGRFVEPQNYANVIVRSQEFGKDSNANGRSLQVERTSLSQPQLLSIQNVNAQVNIDTTTTTTTNVQQQKQQQQQQQQQQSPLHQQQQQHVSLQQQQKQHQLSLPHIQQQHNNNNNNVAVHTEKWNINSKSYKQQTPLYPKQQHNNNNNNNNNQCTCKQTPQHQHQQQHQCTCRQSQVGQQASLTQHQTLIGQQQQQQQQQQQTSPQHSGSQKGKSQRGAHHSSTSGSQKSGNARSGSKRANKSHSTTNFHAQTKSSSSIHEGNSNPGNYLGQSLYKTELCKSFSEFGTCKYGPKCQFAHGIDELRYVEKHPRYKTAICRSYRKFGTCKYGNRCCFLHIGPGEEVPPRILTSTSSLTNLPSTAPTSGGGLQLPEIVTSASSSSTANLTTNASTNRTRHGTGSATSSPYNPSKVKARGGARAVAAGTSTGGIGNTATFGSSGTAELHRSFSLNNSFVNMENGGVMGPAGRDIWKDNAQQKLGWNGVNHHQCESLGNSLGSFSGLNIPANAFGAGNNNATGSASVATCTSLNNSLTSFNFTDCSTSTLPIALGGGGGNSTGSRIDGDDYNIPNLSTIDGMGVDADLMSYAIGTAPLLSQQQQQQQQQHSQYQQTLIRTAGTQNYESMSSATATNGSEIINDNSANSSPTTPLRDANTFTNTSPTHTHNSANNGISSGNNGGGILGGTGHNNNNNNPFLPFTGPFLHQGAATIQLPYKGGSTGGFAYGASLESASASASSYNTRSSASSISSSSSFHMCANTGHAGNRLGGGGGGGLPPLSGGVGGGTWRRGSIESIGSGRDLGGFLGRESLLMEEDELEEMFDGENVLLNGGGGGGGGISNNNGIWNGNGGITFNNWK